MSNAENTTETLTAEQVDAKVREALKKDRDAKPDRSKNESFSDELLDDALAYRETHRETLAEISANRDTLRNFAKLGKLNETQAAAVALLYPVREKKPAAAATTPAPDPTPAPKTPAGNPGVAVKPKP